jgi:acetyltransferase-like isoleucine patch superfamily enzyme
VATDQSKLKSIGTDVTIYDPVVLIRPELMVFNSHIIISEFAYLAAGLGLYLGSYIHISAHTSISGGGACVVEDFVAISAGVRLITGSEDPSGAGLNGPTIPSEFRSVYRSFVHLNRHVFLATNVIVHPGVTIGEGAVIGSGSIVTRDVEPWTVNVGSPAKKTKDRPKDVILGLQEKLTESKGEELTDFSQILAEIKSR